MSDRSQAEQKRRRRLVPDSIASEPERRALDDKTLDKAAEVKTKAKGFRPLRIVTDESWIEHRNILGQTQDRARVLQLVMAATGYMPLPKQLKLHLAGAPGERIDKFYCGGIGTGKSYAAIVEDLIAILLNPGVRGLIVAPTYDQCLHVLLPTFLAFCELMERAGFPILKRFRWSQMRAELVCGGEVFFRSVAKVDNLLGFEFAWVHFDESETVNNPELIWNTLSGRLRQKAWVRQMIATSTPRGLRGVLGIFQRSREGDGDRALLRKQFFFVRSTTLENPHLPPDYIENLRRTLSKAAWDQEVLAKVLRPEAAVYREFERARHEFAWANGKAAFVKRLIETGAEYDLVYDPGETYCHVLWIARFANCDVVFDELCDDGITTDRLHDEIVKRCAALKRHPTGIVIDRAVRKERGWCSDTFQQSSLLYCERRAEQSITEGIAIVKNLLDPMQGEPRLKFCSYLWDRMPRRAIIKCMSNYVYGKQASGLLTRLPFKDNAHDHGADCIRMFAMKRHGEAYRYLVVQRRHAA